jgi:hypothetical protein
MRRAFRRWIGRHPDDGRFILSNGYDWTYFMVDDAPFRVTRCVLAQGGLLLELDDDSQELLTGPLWLGGQGALYARVKGGQFDARFARDVQAGLGATLVETEAGAYGLHDGRRIIPVLSGPPGPPMGPADDPVSAR